MEHSTEPIPRSDRPVDGVGGQLELLLELLDNLEAIEGRAIHFVHNCEDGELAHACHLINILHCRCRHRM